MNRRLPDTCFSWRLLNLTNHWYAKCIPYLKYIFRIIYRMIELESIFRNLITHTPCWHHRGFQYTIHDWSQTSHLIRASITSTELDLICCQRKVLTSCKTESVIWLLNSAQGSCQISHLMDFMAVPRLDSWLDSRLDPRHGFWLDLRLDARLDTGRLDPRFVPKLDT